MILDKKIKFILAVGFQLCILFGIIIFKYSILTGGSAVFLKIMPVDPRDPLRGDYVTFQYDISNLANYYFTYDSNFKNGDIVYVPLRKSGKYWSVYGNISKKINSDASNRNDVVYIKATIVSGANYLSEKNNRRNAGTIRLKYGIEEFFIPEGTGRFFNFNNKEAMAKVMVDDAGNAVLDQIFIDGKKWPQ